MTDFTTMQDVMTVRNSAVGKQRTYPLERSGRAIPRFQFMRAIWWNVAAMVRRNQNIQERPE